MVTFKLTIGESSTGRTFQKEVKDDAAKIFIGLNLGDKINGDHIGVPSYEFEITGGSDYCGFPMRKGILGLRKSLTIMGGVGFKGAGKGVKKRKTVCGHKIHDKISQINLKVLKAGNKSMVEILGLKEEELKAGKKEERKKQKLSQKKTETKQETELKTENAK